MSANPSRSRIVKSSYFDRVRRNLLDSLTASRLASLFQSAERGNLDDLIELNDQMEARDAHLHGVAATRRSALTALDWDIRPAEMAEDRGAADEAAAFVRETITSLKSDDPGQSIDRTFAHLATAIGPNIAVTELLWDGPNLVETVDVPGTRLRASLDFGNTVLVATDDSPSGVPIADLPHKFIVHVPNSKAGWPWSATLTQAQAYCFLVKWYVIRDWASFSEIFGMPFRAAKVAPDATPDERSVVKDMLANMGSEGWGLFTDSVDLQFIESNRGVQPYEALIAWTEKKQSILYLGQTLTTEVGPSGSFAAAKVHENVRTDLLLSDIKAERRTVENQLFAPILKYRFPSRKMPVPEFRRRLYDREDAESQRLALEQLRMARELGLSIDEDTAYQRLNLPKPKAGARIVGKSSMAALDKEKPTAID